MVKLTSSTVQYKTMCILVLFGYFFQLAVTGAGQILRFRKNEPEIQIQHYQNIWNKYLKDSHHQINSLHCPMQNSVDFGTFRYFGKFGVAIAGQILKFSKKWPEIRIQHYQIV